jgi:AraC family transcriptional regulator, carnitine catabolism transcriptional activator
MPRSARSPQPASAARTRTFDRIGHVRSKPYQVGFILLPEFSYFGLIAATQPLFLANWRAQHALFAWSALSCDGAPVRASNGTLTNVDAQVGTRRGFDTLLVLASFDPKRHAGNASLRYELIRAAARGIEIGGIETGSEVLAAAGLLDGRLAAVHWDNLDGFRERYPKVEATDRMFHAEPGFLTCAGGTAVIDLMIHLVAREGGEPLAVEVAEQMLVGRPRPPALKQLADSGAMPDGGSELIRAAAALMKQSPDNPLSVPEIARRLAVSPRHLRRQFRDLLGTTTLRYYLRLRLAQAHNLLEQTDLSVTEIAVATGFRSLEHFSRAYRALFGCAPSRDRQQIVTAPIYRSGYRVALARSETPRREMGRGARRRPRSH